MSFISLYSSATAFIPLQPTLDTTGHSCLQALRVQEMTCKISQDDFSTPTKAGVVVRTDHKNTTGSPKDGNEEMISSVPMPSLFSQDSHANALTENMPGHGVDFVSNRSPQIGTKTSHNTPLCLEEGTSLTTTALESTDTRAHQNISFDTVTAERNLTLHQIGNESITPAQSFPKMRKMSYLNGMLVNPYKAKPSVHAQDKSNQYQRNNQHSSTNTGKKRLGSTTIDEHFEKKRHRFSAINEKTTKTRAEELNRSLTRACAFCNSNRCAGQSCRTSYPQPQSTRCYYCTGNHWARDCDTKYKEICKNCKKINPKAMKKRQNKACCVVMVPVQADNTFKKLSTFLNPKEVCVQCFDSFGEGCRRGQHQCQGRLREIIIRHATINKKSLYETVRKIFMSRDSRLQFLASVDIVQLANV